MAGSLRPFGYIGDDGETYRIDRDESNTETINGASTIPQNAPSLPVGCRPRYALLRSTTTGKQRKVTILDPTTFGTLNGSTDFTLDVVGDADGETFRISSLIGEKREKLFVDDSGDNDGDNDPVAPIA